MQKTRTYTIISDGKEEYVIVEYVEYAKTSPLGQGSKDALIPFIARWSGGWSFSLLGA